MYKPLKIQTFLRDGGTLKELREEPYNLKINADSDKRRILFKYNQIESDMSLQICEEARGLILDSKNDWEVISFPFLKFFNYGESHASDIDWNSARIWEKMDGSCSVLYHYENEWVMHTLGTVEGEGDVHVDDLISTPFGGTFSDLFFYTWDKVYGKEKLNQLNEDYIYVFELMTPYNVVVKEYDELKLTLLAVRNRKTLNEVDVLSFEDEFNVPELFDFNNPSLDDLLSSLDRFPPDDEGYVVCDSEYNRIKIKNPDYLILHKMKDNAVNRKNGILEIILNEKDDDLMSRFPNMKEDIIEIKSDLKSLLNFLEESYESFNGSDVDPEDSDERKRFALKVQSEIPTSMRSYMFTKLTSDESTDFESLVKDSRVDKVASALNSFKQMN